MASETITRANPSIVIQHTKVMTLTNQDYAALLTRSEIATLLGYDPAGGLNDVSVYAYNADWNAYQFKITSIIRQDSTIYGFFDQAVTHNVRINFIIVAKRP